MATQRVDRLASRAREVATVSAQDRGGQLLTLAEAGQFLRLSHNTLRKQIRLGRLSAVVIGRRKFVAPSELDRFIAHNSTNGGAA